MQTEVEQVKNPRRMHRRLLSGAPPLSRGPIGSAWEAFSL